MKQIDALGNETNYEFDALGRIAKTIDPSGNQEIFLRNAAGRLIAHQDALLNTTRYDY